MFVPVVDVLRNRGDQFIDTRDREAADAALGEFTEEAFDEIEPRRRGGREVKGDARMPEEPACHLGVLVRGVVIEDDVNGQVARHTPLHLAHELEEFLMAVVRHTVLQQTAGGHVKRGEQRGRAVPFVVVGPGAEAALLHGQSWLRAVQRLDLTLLVEGKHHGPFGRPEVEANDVAQLGDECGIRGQFELLDAMRLQPMRAPDPGDRRMMVARHLGHQSGAPVRGLLRGLGAQSALDDRLLVRKRDLLRPPRTRAIHFEPAHTVRVVAIQPARDGRARDPQLRTDRIPRRSSSGGQHDLRALDHAVGGGARPDQHFQSAAVAAT